MELSDNTISQVNIIDKYANRPDSLENMCLADFGTTYIGKNSVEVSTDSDGIKNYTIPVSAVNVDNEIPEDVTEQLSSEQQANLITLKNDLGKMKKKSRPCVMRCHMESKLRNPEQCYMTLLQLYMPWSNEDNLKGTYHTFEEKYLVAESTIKPNILKHNECFETLDSNDDIPDNHYDYSSSTDNSDGDNDYENDFSMLNHNLIDFDSRDEDNRDIYEPIGPIASALVANTSLPWQVFYEMGSQLNEGQQNLYYEVCNKMHVKWAKWSRYAWPIGYIFEWRSWC